MINICSPVQEETIEREDLSRASNSVQWSRQARFGEGLQSGSRSTAASRMVSRVCTRSAVILVNL